MDTDSQGGVSVKRGSAGGADCSPARQTVRGLFLATWQGLETWVREGLRESDKSSSAKVFPASGQ